MLSACRSVIPRSLFVYPQRERSRSLSKSRSPVRSRSRSRSRDRSRSRSRYCTLCDKAINVWPWLYSQSAAGQELAEVEAETEMSGGVQGAAPETALLTGTEAALMTGIASGAGTCKRILLQLQQHFLFRLQSAQQVSSPSRKVRQRYGPTKIQISCTIPTAGSYNRSTPVCCWAQLHHQ